MILRFADVELDLDRYELRRAGNPVAAEPQVFDVLAYLAGHRERVVPKEELLDNVWGDRFVGESALTSRIKTARRLIGDDGSHQRLIRTVHGRGYRLVADVQEAPAAPAPAASGLASPQPEPGPVAAAPLIEREGPLAALLGALGAAAAGAGRVVFVGGEAGVGKTALVRHFADAAADRADVLVGAADDLGTPMVLGAVRDIVGQLPDDLRAGASGEGGVEDVLGALAALARRSGRPVVAVVEDVHWADDATFDVVRYLARRIRTVPVVLVLTYRDDAAAVGHPLRQLLGSVRGPEVVRITLEPLSRHGVAVLAEGSVLDADEIHRVTGGNPLFVSEVVASPADTVPDTVRDAVLARVEQLPGPAAEAVRRLAVVPNRLERWLARELVVGGEERWTAAERAGLLDGDAARVWFRHELVRRAIEETLTASERLTAHRLVAGRLQARRAEPSRVVHHAVRSGDVDLLVAVGPDAAREAQRTGAHRQAAMHLDAVLAHADRLSAAVRAELLTERAHSLYLLNEFDESLACAERAVALLEGVAAVEADDAGSAGDAVEADRDRLARALLTLGRTLLWAKGPRACAEVEQRALEVLGPTGDAELRAVAHADLARAMGELVTVGSIAQGNPAAVDHAAQALALATRLGRTDLRGYALMYRGCERWALGDDGGEADIDEAVALLRTLPRVDLAVRACVNASGAAYRAGRFEQAEHHVEVGFELGRDAEFVSGQYRLSLTRACVRSSVGRWAEAEAELADLLARAGEPGIMDPLARSVLARLLARQGRAAEAAQVLAPAERSARADEVRVMGPVLLARLELAWLSGADVDLAGLARPVLEHSAAASGTAVRAEVARYLQRAGVATGPVAGAPGPWAAGLRGDWAGAAAQWAARGETYEEALELCSGEDAASVATGRELLRSLGATGTLDALGR